MNVYITKSNASKIIMNLNLSKIEIEGNLYKEEKNRILKAMFSKYEQHELLAFKKLMENPEEFMNEIYEKLPIKEDTFWWVYEEHNPPAYHFDLACPRLKSDFKNYKIPTSIRFRNIFFDGNREFLVMKKLNTEEKEILEKNVDEYRNWWRSEGDILYEKDKDIFLMRVNNRFPGAMIRSITEFDAKNSGVETICSNNPMDIEAKIDQLIRESGQYYHKSDKNRSILSNYSKRNPYTTKPFSSNNTGYKDDEIRELLKEYNKLFKFPLKYYLKEYYRIKNNPDLKMEDSLLEQLGFRSCGCCYKNEINRIQSEIDESNMDQIDLRGVGVPVEDDFVDDIDSWSDMEMEIMLEADEYNDMVYWENVIREESL